MKDFRFTEEWCEVGDYQVFVMRGNYQDYLFTANTVLPEGLIINQKEL